MAGVSKQLICPRCEKVMAAAVLGVFRTADFRGIADHHAGRPSPGPSASHVLLTIAEQRLESASAEDYPEAKRRHDFIVRNSGDRLYDIKCPDGHYTLKTAPQITKAIRQTAGTWVTLT